MAKRERIVREVRAALRAEPRFGPRGHIDLDYVDGALIMEGEVADVSLKKLLLRHAAAHPEVDGVVDRLRVTPAQRMGDGELREHLVAVLLQEPALAEIAIRVRDKGKPVQVRDIPHGPRGEIDIAVDDGVVTLDGRVPGLAYKRLAGLLAWWVPGSRDVINGMSTPADEEDRDEEITDAVRIALEKDPFVNASQMRVTTKDSVVTLQGIVPKEAEREMAEFDAWYVFGVDRVDNQLQVRAVPPTGQT